MSPTAFLSGDQEGHSFSRVKDGELLPPPFGWYEGCCSQCSLNRAERPHLGRETVLPGEVWSFLRCQLWEASRWGNTFKFCLVLSLSLPVLSLSLSSLSLSLSLHIYLSVLSITYLSRIHLSIHHLSLPPHSPWLPMQGNLHH